MSGQVVEVGDAQQRMQYPAVAQIDFWGFHQAFAEVDLKRGEAAQHVGRFQYVQIMLDGWRRYAKPRCQAGGVPQLSVQVREHLPETMQCRARHTYAEGGDVALQVGGDEGFPPCERGGIRLCQPAQRVTSAQPEILQFKMGGIDFAYIERGEFVKRDAPRQ